MGQLFINIHTNTFKMRLTSLCLFLITISTSSALIKQFFSAIKDGSFAEGIGNAKAETIGYLLGLKKLKFTEETTTTEEAITTTTEEPTTTEETITTTTEVIEETTPDASGRTPEGPRCSREDVEVLVDVCEDKKVCGPKSRMECVAVEEEECKEVEEEECWNLRSCNTIYKTVCKEGRCSQQLVDE